MAGTGSHKPYLFNAENVARFAPAPWQSTGTVVDASYEVLQAIAHATAKAAMFMAAGLVYAALGEAMKEKVHAFTFKTYTKAAWARVLVK